MATIKTSKEEIVKKAYQVFRTKGYHHTSIADLSAFCGIRNAHFYYYFKNKEDLMLEVLNLVKQYFKTKLLLLIENDTLSSKEKLQQIKFFFEKNYHYDNGGCIMANTVLETALSESSFLATIKDFFEFLFATLKLLFLSQYQDSKAQELAEATIQDIEGGIMLMKLYKDNKYLMNALKRAEKLLD
ncbi:MAG: TetR/AcrR family transcriptional regulator [Bacteroidetes bacterium]|nr:MAG: TetR/AcrR family transcriptional regulator [Bacteroidota bacterium]TAG85674.1 MAG: TetR/AcrR family transcriptional regulator [Bacteroidota bacterium]